MAEESRPQTGASVGSRVASSAGGGGGDGGDGGLGAADWKHDMGVGGGDGKNKMDVLSLAPKDELRSDLDPEGEGGKKKKTWFGSGGDKKSDAAAKAAKAEKNAKSSGKNKGPYVPQGDPFEPGGNFIPPPYDPVQSEINMKKLSVTKLEKVVGRQIPPAVGLRVWLALGCRGLGVQGEEGLGTIVMVGNENKQIRIKWDEFGLEGDYSSGMYGVYHVSVFEYVEQRDWMTKVHRTNWQKKNKGLPPRIDRNKELEYMLGFRQDEQLKHRVSYMKSRCVVS